MLLVSTVRTQFELLKQDITDVSSAAFLQWCNAIHRYAYRKLKAAEPERFKKSASYTISSAPSTQALPADFGGMTDYGCGVYLPDSTVKLSMTGFNSEDKGYYLSGSNIVFTGIEDGETYTLRYMPTITALSSTASYFSDDTLVTGVQIIEDDDIDFVLQALDVKYSQWDNSTGDEANADQRFIRVMDEMLSNYKRTPKVYARSDISNSF